LNRLLARRPSPAMVVALIALFCSLGGVSYGVARGTIGSSAIKDNSVRSKDVRNNTLTGADVNESKLGQVAHATSADAAAAAGVAGKVFDTYRDSGISLPVSPISDPPNAYTTVLSLNVPAGSYLIIGKGWIRNDGPGEARSRCRTVAENNRDLQLLGVAGRNDATPWTNTVVHKFSTPGTITLECQSATQPLTVFDRKIQALQVREVSSVLGG
jgi:hypothetical protein